MVSGMLSAIQSFVKDAFDTEEFDGLNTLSLGDVSVWIEWAPEAVLAAVVRGVPPKNLRDALQILLENIHSRYTQELSAYEGDASPFDALEPELYLFLDKHDGSLKNRFKNLPTRAKQYFTAFALICCLCLLRLCYGLYDSARWSDFVAALEAQPGIVVTGETRQFRNYQVSGLRDPLAVDPAELLANTSIKPDFVNYQLEPYQATHPEFVLQRAVKALDPPEGVEMTMTNDVLRISGAASAEWLQSARNFARTLPGVNRVIILLPKE